VLTASFESTSSVAAPASQAAALFARAPRRYDGFRLLSIANLLRNSFPMPVAVENPFVRLHPDDNLLIARIGVATGVEVVPGNGDAEVVTRDRIDLGHKMAVRTIPAGAPVRKFGQLIGYATEDIQPGEWIHSHNLSVGALQLDYAYSTEIPPEPEPITGRTFQGFRRADGRAATRNYLGIVSTVNCSATTSKAVAERINHELLAEFPNIAGVVPLVHKGGCAMQYGGSDHQQLARVLAGFARHPNFAGYLIIGLGCETGQASFLTENYGLTQLDVPGENGRDPRPLMMTIQDSGGVRKTIDRAVGALKEMLPAANDVRRVPIPVSELILGTECGGSDGNSGVTANPAVGIASDLLVAHGGTSILGETTEIYGGEHLLTRRAVTPEVGRKLVDLIHWWEDYTKFFGVQIDNNPSVGNKQGGLTTIYEKSLGAIAKGGSTALKEVYRYAEPVSAKGFVVMDTPGFDPASVTGFVAGGANVVVFTTGRGSCFGCKPVPSIKIATNTPMYERMIEDMDINAGRILDGVPVEEVGREIFEKIVSVASGEKTKSEAQGIGDEEFCPWNIGPVL
jgi:arabinonate dehydratase